MIILLCPLGTLFFSFFLIFDIFCVCKNFSYFLNQKKKKTKGKKRICGRPNGHDFGHPLVRKQTFLRVAPCCRLRGIDRDTGPTDLLTRESPTNVNRSIFWPILQLTQSDNPITTVGGGRLWVGPLTRTEGQRDGKVHTHSMWRHKAILKKNIVSCPAGDQNDDQSGGWIF